jgi:hypothetical protein
MELSSGDIQRLACRGQAIGSWTTRCISWPCPAFELVLPGDASGLSETRPARPVVVGGDGGLDGVLVALAADECLAAWASLLGPADPDLGGVHAQGDALGGGVGEQVGQGVQPGPGRGGATTAGEQRTDLGAGAGDGVARSTWYATARAACGIARRRWTRVITTRSVKLRRGRPPDLRTRSGPRRACNRSSRAAVQAGCRSLSSRPRWLRLRPVKAQWAKAARIALIDTIKTSARPSLSRSSRHAARCYCAQGRKIGINGVLVCVDLIQTIYPCRGQQHLTTSRLPTR